MKINTDSWHYRYWSWSRRKDGLLARYATVSLCSYCQRIFFTSLLIFLLGLVCLGIVSCFLFLVFYTALWCHPIGTLTVIACLAAFFGAGYLTFRFLQYLEGKPAGLVQQWWQARKEGICPIVEFQDPGQEQEQEE